MNFYCKCGERISDITDYISYKAHMIADQDWADFFERIDEAIQSDEADREKVIDEFFHDTLDVDNIMYQCRKCGRIFINGKGGTLYSFSPETPVPANLLRSAKGERWQGSLTAEWKDVKPEWSEHHGYIFPNVNMRYDNLEFDDYDAFTERYYQLFEELKNKGIIRYAVLKRNKEKIHQWEAEKKEKRWNID